MRFAAYVRISSEDQVGNFSIDAQSRLIQEWIDNHQGILVKTYVDQARSGHRTNRPGFKQMR
ncbi:recombinase family protein [Chloroflexi bacterium TSY]|nr:recombinase family protein [Chloroflexi bacterium TSY]